MNEQVIRILLVDDHAIVREGYRSLLSKHAEFVVVGEVADAAAAYQAYKDLCPNVVVMDISMPGRGGIDAIAHLRGFDPRARVLVFTMHNGVVYALQAFRAGAKGYVTKCSAPDVLVDAIRTVAKGGTAICPETSQVLALHQVGEETSQLTILSPREFEILRMLVDAHSTDRIAAALNISRKTVANYHYLIKQKLGAANDIELLHYGLRQGLLNPTAQKEGLAGSCLGRTPF